jgi:hypothetical protein
MEHLDEIDRRVVHDRCKALMREQTDLICQKTTIVAFFLH